MRLLNLLALFLLCGLSVPALADNQEASPELLETRPFQLGFVTPLGTNGWESWKVINRFSLNILTGYAAGVRGFELSGIGSLLKTDMQGAQLAGVGNLVLENMSGAQLAGVGNIVLGSSHGFQMAGISNIVLKDSAGAQIAGAANIVQGDSKGAQVAGALNVVQGKQHGVQLAGLLNYTNTLKGLQFGIINYANEVDGGLPIGIVSIVKNGYRAFELSANESIYGLASFKIGLRKFYSIFSVGGGYRHERSLFAYGFGFGGLIPVAEKLDIAVEGQGFHVNEGEWFSKGINTLARLSASLSWSLADHFTLFAGPTLNIAVSDSIKKDGSGIAPWSLIKTSTTNVIYVKFYPGLTIGMRI